MPINMVCDLRNKNVFMRFKKKLLYYILNVQMCFMALRA